MSASPILWGVLAALAAAIFLALVGIAANPTVIGAERGFVGLMGGGLFAALMNLCVTMFALSCKEDSNVKSETRYFRQRISSMMYFLELAKNKDNKYKISDHENTEPDFHAMKRIVDHLSFVETLGRQALERPIRAKFHEDTVHEITRALQRVTAILTYMRDEKWMDLGPKIVEHVKKSLSDQLPRSIRHLEAANKGVGKRRLVEGPSLHPHPHRLI